MAASLSYHVVSCAGRQPSQTDIRCLYGQISVKLAFSNTMEITEWYALALACVAASALVFCLTWSLAKLIHRHGAFLFLKHIVYPQIPRYLRGSGKTTRFDVLLIAAFLIANILCLTVKVHDSSTFVKRTGQMSAINMIPLALGHQTNLIFDRCGISSEDCGRMHRWLGRTAVAEGLVHSIVAVTSRTPNMRATPRVAAWVVSLQRPGRLIGG